MQTSKSIRNTRLHIECAPTFGRGYLAPDEDCLYASLAHLIPFLIWPWMKGSSPAVNAHGKEAFNMAVTWLLVLMPLALLARFATGFLAIICLALFAMAGLAAVWFGLMGLSQARRGRLLRYPFNLRLIK